MRIAITNDDGIRAEGLRVLVEWARRLGEVVVYAPKTEQSGKSHSIELHRAIEVLPVDYMDGVKAYSVDSTPSDCVRYALLGAKEKFDLVISGINRGFNIGRDVIYSGTVGAAFEAVALGAKAVAISTDPATYEGIGRHLDTVAELFERHRLLERHDLFNVNIPLQPRGVRFTRQGGPYYTDDFPAQGNQLYMPTGRLAYTDSGDDTLDTDATMHGYITVSPLTIIRTDMTMYEQLRKLEQGE